MTIYLHQSFISPCVVCGPQYAKSEKAVASSRGRQAMAQHPTSSTALLGKFSCVLCIHTPTWICSGCLNHGLSIANSGLLLVYNNCVKRVCK